MFNLFKREKKIGTNKVKKQFVALRAAHSGTCLDAQGGKMNASAIIWKDNEGQNQQWTFSPAGPGFRIKNRQTKQYLTVLGNGKGAKIGLRDGTNDMNQVFKLKQTKPGSKIYTIWTFQNFVLDCEQQSKKNGTHICQWEENGQQNQHWNLCDPKNVTSSSDQWEGA